MNCNNLIGKQIVNIFDGKIEGTISDVVLINTSKIKYLKFFTIDEEEFLLDTSKIFGIGDAISIKNSSAINPAINLQNGTSPLTLDVFSTSGEHFGKIDNIEIDNNFNLLSIIASDKKFPASEILNINKIVLMCKDEKTKLHHFKPSIPKIEKAQNEVVKILPTTAPTIETSQDGNKDKFLIDKTPSPKKVVVGLGSGKFLVGKLATKTVFGNNNEVIARKDEKIISRTVELAKKHGKLLELALYSVDK